MTKEPGVEGLCDLVLYLMELIEKQKAALAEANEVLRSAYSVAARQGKETNWEAFTNRVDGVLKAQHPMIFGRERAESPR